MNIVEATGGRKKYRDIAIHTAYLCIDKLMPRMKTLEITIEFEKLDGEYGLCLEGVNNRTFTITIEKSLSLHEVISTIAHEMVHVKQYARNELTHVDGKHMWKSRLYKKFNYWTCPWEKEAFAMEDELSSFVLDKLGIA